MMGDEKETSQHEFYVGLLESERIQRDLLESRKAALILLKRFEKAMLLREQRLYVENELRSAINELSSELDGIMSSFPDLPEAKEQKAEPTRVKKQVKKAKQSSQMSALDKKLAEIDKRLKELE